MGDGPRGIKIYSDHFESSTSSSDIARITTPSSLSLQKAQNLSRLHTRFWTRKKLISAAAMLKLFSFKGLSWGSDTGDQEKVVLTVGEVESLRSGICDLEERESYLKAQLEHVNEILRSARLSGYLHVRTRWAALPGEPPPIDDMDVDDWLPRFLVYHGSCIFFYLQSTDLSPQDSALLCDITEVGPLPSYTREDGETRYCFYILTCHGLRFECSNSSKVQVAVWLTTLQVDCKLEPELIDLPNIKETNDPSTLS